MPDKTIETLKIRIDILQEKVWSSEEMINKHIDCIANQESELQKIKLITKKNQAKLAKLENTILNIKNKGGSI